MKGREREGGNKVKKGGWEAGGEVRSKLKGGKHSKWRPGTGGKQARAHQEGSKGREGQAAARPDLTDQRCQLN